MDIHWISRPFPENTETLISKPKCIYSWLLKFYRAKGYLSLLIYIFLLSHGKFVLWKIWGRGWDDLGEWHWNTYNIIYETSRQSRFDARYWMLGAGALGQPRGMVWGVRWEEGSGWGTHVYLWWIHFDIWQNQYNKV